jgi:hypoxanthine phosphoribosyltransferase
MEGKLYLDANELFYDSLELAKKVLDSGFKPDFLVAIWRGGTPIGIVVQEYLKYKNVKTDHIAIRTSGYDEDDNPLDKIKVYGLDYIIANANSSDNLLIIDDVWDRGLSVVAVKDQLMDKMRNNLPKNIKVATVYYKPEKNMTQEEPDFYLKSVSKDTWIVFPHEFSGLTKEEIIKNKGPDMDKYF